MPISYTGPVPPQPTGTSTTAVWDLWMRYQDCLAQFAVATAQERVATTEYVKLGRALAGLPPDPPAPPPAPAPTPEPPAPAPTPAPPGQTPAERALPHLNAALAKLREFAISAPNNTVIPRIAADVEQAKRELSS